jgi:hypothetical protein
VTAGHEDGSGEVSADVREGKTLRFAVNPRVTGRALARLANDRRFVALIDRIYDGHGMEDEDGPCVLSEEAEKACRELQDMLDGYFDPSGPGRDVAWMAADLFTLHGRDFLEVWPKDRTLKEAVAALAAEGKWTGKLSEVLLDMAEAMFVAEADALGSVHLEALSAAGRITGEGGRECPGAAEEAENAGPFRTAIDN